MNDSGTLDDRYFEWLYKQVASVRNRNPFRSFWHLARVMYTTPFFWFVHNDDNRVEDGKELRQEFLKQMQIRHPDLDWIELDCSMLEMFIALARRAAFETEGEIINWFWKFMQNLELANFSDAAWNDHIEETVKNTLEEVCRRTYGRDGTGGIFPLRYPRGDQRTVELWTQLNAYIMENDYVEHGP